MATLFRPGDRSITRATRARKLRVLRIEDWRDDGATRFRDLVRGGGARASAAALLATLASIVLVAGVRQASDPAWALSVFTLACVAAGVLGSVARALAPRSTESARAALRLGALLVVALALVRVCLLVGMPYLAPVPMVIAIASIAYGPALASVLSLLVAAGGAIAVARTRGELVEGLDYGLALALGSIVVAVRTSRVTSRAALFRAGFASGLVMAATVVATHYAHGGRPFAEGGTPGELFGAVYALIQGGLFGFVVFEILPWVERLYGALTDITLQDLGDLNNPTLKRMNLEAPGTFHHSQVVARLAEAAADAIGANGLLARVGAYYHDLGKIAKPAYFTENNRESGSKHGALSPTLSALVIHAHVKDGVELARELGLPEQIVAFIPEHHGTTACEYFYRQALKDAQSRGETVDKEIFRYPGPRPRTRETAILLICDSTEAVTRSLGEPTPSRIQSIVHEVILDKLLDGQFDDSPLTLGDLARIEVAVARVLTGIYHGRVKYPSKPQPQTTEARRVEQIVREHGARASEAAERPEEPPRGDRSYEPPMTW